MDVRCNVHACAQTFWPVVGGVSTIDGIMAALKVHAWS